VRTSRGGVGRIVKGWRGRPRGVAGGVVKGLAEGLVGPGCQSGEENRSVCSATCPGRSACLESSWQITSGEVLVTQPLPRTGS
jgi:hypothetical protein